MILIYWLFKKLETVIMRIQFEQDLVFVGIRSGHARHIQVQPGNYLPVVKQGTIYDIEFADVPSYRPP